MTKKQFTIESERINSTYSIRIFKDREVIFEVSNWNSLSTMHKRECEDIVDLLNKLSDKNKQLEQDNNALMHLLENQSIIIQELSSKIFEYQLKEPIILTKEDIEIMGKAISYYTHGRCGE